VRFLGEVENTPARIERLIKKLAARYRSNCSPGERDGVRERRGAVFCGRRNDG
jgi:hypothetical protein